MLSGCCLRVGSHEQHNNSFSLAPSDGPYNVLDERVYFQAGAGGKVNAGGEKASGIIFQPETGNLATPTHASLKRFLSPEVVADFPTQGADPEGHQNGSNAVWNYHKYITTTEKETDPETRKPTRGRWDHIYMYGAPADTAAYCKRGQLMQLVQYKALFEGYLEHMMAPQVGTQYGYTAVIFWKSQSPWPAMRGALYDSYLATTGGFWGARAALQPLHVQLNLHTMRLTVVNMRAEQSPATVVRVSAYSVPGGKKLTLPFATVTVDALPAVSRRQLLLHHVTWPSEVLAADAVVLYRLELVHAVDATPISSNEYWRSNPASHQDYSSLAAIEYSTGGAPGVEVGIMATPVLIPSTLVGPLEVEYTLELTNHGTEMAFGVSLEVRNKTAVTQQQQQQQQDVAVAFGAAGETRLLPVWFSDNLFALLPAEKREVTLRLSQDAMQVGMHQVSLEGWNVRPAQAMLPPPNVAAEE